ncbi:MAG: ORF6N domain-containing protein [Bacilli bacterium]|nr:ORF6N domain-containing protein [Bacilli bacterium]
MNKLFLKEEIKIENMIYEIRGKQVMLDSDLAFLYECKNGTKTINQAVNRHINKFPKRYMFQLTKEEYLNLKSQIGTSNINNYGGVRKLPNVFTEQGVAMLATILKTPVADIISMNIIDAFVNMKKYISSNLIEQKYINTLVLEDRERINKLEETFNSFKEKNNHLFFEGQIYDSYSLMIDIFNKVKNEIIIIDNYIDKNILDILSKINKNIIIYTNKYNNNDYIKYKSQYINIDLKVTNMFHDRFIILDKKILYHCGASFKDLGNKCFEISKIEEEDILNKILDKLNDKF